MTDFEIEKKLRDAIDASVPDVLDNILSRCEPRKGKIIEMSEIKDKRNTSNKKNWMKPLCATAAALALVVGGAFGIGQYNLAYAVDTIVTMDVNPSIELSANKEETVIATAALNEDGEKVLEGMDLKGLKLDEATNKIANSMVEEGYINEAANSILVSVINDDSAKSTEMEKRLSESVNKAISDQGIEGAILSLTEGKNTDLEKLASDLNISEGKASLIQSIVEKEPDLSAADLSKLNINDLSLIAYKWIGQIEGLTLTGTPSDKNYIGADAAATNAEAHANLSENGNANIEAQMDYKDGKLVYSVKMTTENSEFTYGIDAKTGEILKWVVNAINTAADNANDSTSTSSGNTGSSSGTGTGTSQNSGNTQNTQDLIKKALDMAGVDASSAGDVDVSVGNTNANSEYEIKFKSGDLEYSFSFDATTGGLTGWAGSQNQK